MKRYALMVHVIHASAHASASPEAVTGSQHRSRATRLEQIQTINQTTLMTSSPNFHLPNPVLTQTQRTSPDCHGRSTDRPGLKQGSFVSAVSVDMFFIPHCRNTSLRFSASSFPKFVRVGLITGDGVVGRSGVLEDGDYWWSRNCLSLQRVLSLLADSFQ
jgi:hypothetical protein